MIHWPERLVYGGVSFPILFVDRVDGENSGELCFQDGEVQVRVSETLSGDYRDLVVCHELIHAWLHLSGVKIEDEATEELLCDTLGQGLLQLLQVTSGEARGDVVRDSRELAGALDEENPTGVRMATFDPSMPGVK